MTGVGLVQPPGPALEPLNQRFHVSHPVYNCLATLTLDSIKESRELGVVCHMFARSSYYSKTWFFIDHSLGMLCCMLCES